LVRKKGMGMKSLGIVCLSVALVLPPLVLAKLALPNDALGRVEGALDFCARTNPHSASKYEEKKKELLQGASDQEVAEARASKEYKAGYDAGTDQIAKQSQDQVKKMCAAALESKN
jgi:hypothetical protein